MRKRKKRRIGFSKGIAVCLSLVMLLSIVPNARASAKDTQAEKNIVIYLVAGHDSTHAGAQTYQYSEEKLAYKVVQYCKAELEQYKDVTVYTDRDSLACKYAKESWQYCLNRRIYDAKEVGANIYLDFHFNAGGSNGVEVYYPNISHHMGIHREGKLLATEIAAQISSLGMVNRGALTRNCTTNYQDEYGNPDDYYTSVRLSKLLGMTGLIIEHGYLDGVYDSQLLKNETFLKQLGKADADAIAKVYHLSKDGEAGQMHFVDISEKEWYYSYLEYVYEEDIMMGLTPTRFAPSDSLCRAQFATIIHRLENEPEAQFTDVFSDISDGQYYTIPVMWASREDVGILTGYDSGEFGPADTLTREQLVTILYRYMQYLGLDTSARADLSIYPDSDEVSEFAKEAMEWAVEKKLIEGDKGMLVPFGGANRAECAALIMRFQELKQNEKPAESEEEESGEKEHSDEETDSGDEENPEEHKDDVEEQNKSEEENSTNQEDSAEKGQ